MYAYKFQKGGFTLVETQNIYINSIIKNPFLEGTILCKRNGAYINSQHLQRNDDIKQVENYILAHVYLYTFLRWLFNHGLQPFKYAIFYDIFETVKIQKITMF